MDSSGQNSTESRIMVLVDNLDLKRDFENEQYILLIKRQQGKDYSTMYLTNCGEDFWLRKIDLKFLQQLKQDLKLNASTEMFVKCLLKSIKENCEIKIQKGEAQIQLKLQIGQGLTMKCVIKFTASIIRSKDEESHKIITKLFLRQLYQSKQSKENSIQKQIEALKQSKEEDRKYVEPQKKDRKFINDLVNFSDEKKDMNKNLKNRDLLNPNRVKRKHAGVKLSTPN